MWSAATCVGESALLTKQFVTECPFQAVANSELPDGITVEQVVERNVANLQSRFAEVIDVDAL